MISQKYVGDNSLINAIAESNSISDINLIYSGQMPIILTEGSAQAAAEPQAAVQEAPVKLNNLLYKEVQTEKQAAPVAETQPAPAVETAATPASTSSAKNGSLKKESSGSYTATNGRYIGRYQLDSSLKW